MGEQIYGKVVPGV